MTSSVAQNILLLDQMGRVLNENDDAELVARLLAARDDTKAVCARKEAAMKEIVRSLCGEVEKLKDETADPPERKWQEQQEALREQREGVERTIEEFEGVVGEEQRKLAEVAEGEAREEATFEEERARTVVQVPAIKSTLKLFKNTTNIVWDYEFKDEVKGFVHMPHSKEVRAFHLTPQTEVSSRKRQDVANFLWDLMWEDQEAAAAAAGEQ